jgi:hypothetical protein
MRENYFFEKEQKRKLDRGKGRERKRSLGGGLSKSRQREMGLRVTSPLDRGARKIGG